MKTIYFIRHGESEANAQGLLAGSTSDTPLTQKGVDQAHAVGKRLKEKQIDLIVASSLERAYETAKIIAQEVGFTQHIKTSDLLLERDFGTATGQPKAQAYALLDNGGAVGAESLEVLHSRVIAALEWLQSLPANHIVVASHAGFGRMIKVVLDGGSWEHFMQQAALNNGDIFEFTLE